MQRKEEKICFFFKNRLLLLGVRQNCTFLLPFLSHRYFSISHVCSKWTCSTFSIARDQTQNGLWCFSLSSKVRLFQSLPRFFLHLLKGEISQKIRFQEPVLLSHYCISIGIPPSTVGIFAYPPHSAYPPNPAQLLPSRAPLPPRAPSSQRACLFLLRAFSSRTLVEWIRRSPVEWWAIGRFAALQWWDPRCTSMHSVNLRWYIFHLNLFIKTVGQSCTRIRSFVKCA